MWRRNMPNSSACIACGCFDRVARVQLDAYRIDGCPSCGMHTLDPSPVDVVLDEFNTGEGYQGAFDLETEMLARHEVSLRHLERSVTPGRLLDVGSGPGFLLKAARERGWTPVGLDPSPFAVAQARDAGFEAHAGMLEEVDLDEASFDALALLQVIEHVTDPRPLLAACRRLLRPGGAIVVATPNPRSLLARTKREGFNYWIPPVHCVWYTPRALTMVLRRAGFRVVHRTTWSARLPQMHDGVDSLRHTRLGKVLPTRTHRAAGDVLAVASDLIGLGSITEQIAIREER